LNFHEYYARWAKFFRLRQPKRACTVRRAARPALECLAAPPGLSPSGMDLNAIAGALFKGPVASFTAAYADTSRIIFTMRFIAVLRMTAAAIRFLHLGNSLRNVQLDPREYHGEF
jgi:hypothetical protein